MISLLAGRPEVAAALRRHFGKPCRGNDWWRPRRLPHTAHYLPRTMTAATPSAALSASVLVLNRFYMAVHVVNVRRALGLLFRELAEVIHFEEGQYANYNFQSWREISALRAAFKEQHDDWIRGV